MGGSSKKVVVGYKYYLGMHMGLCHGPVDQLLRIDVDKRKAWEGIVYDGQLTISKPGLFGGESREGGVSGAVDFESGKPTQDANDYLASKLGDVPAFRGVAAAVLRRVYVGMNPYIKNWAFRVQRVFTRQDGIAQWYQAKAPIGHINSLPKAIYLALDHSGSMTTIVSNGETRFENQRQAIYGVLDFVWGLKQIGLIEQLDIMIVGWGTNPDSRTSSLQRNITTQSQIDTLKAFLPDTHGSGVWTYFPAALLDAESFFDGAPTDAERTIIFTTDGGPSTNNSSETSEEIAQGAKDLLDALTDVRSFAINIDHPTTTWTAYVDNTPYDGVPIVNGGDPEAMENIIKGALYGQVDLNPAHIVRECLTDPDWGMGYADADIDDTSFMEASDALFDEAMGISLLWDRETPIEDFVRDILRHIDATLYVDNSTGKFVLNLIRDDYDPESLVELDESNVERLEGYKRPTVGELVNSVTINYWDWQTEKTGSLTLQDTALAQMQGGTINATNEYPGFTNRAVAERVAGRDLYALSNPLVSCTIYANRDAAALNVGKPFKLSWPDYGIQSMVMRVTEIAFGDGQTNKVRLQCVQDAFALPVGLETVDQPSEWTDPVSEPDNCPHPIALEAPYYELVQRQGQAAVDDALTADDTIGYLLLAGDRPNDGAINARLYVDAGAGYNEAETAQFSLYAEVAVAISYLDETITIQAAVDTDLVTAGTHAQIGQEIVKVVSVTSTTLSAKRGCLDTVPATHAIGTAVHFWDEFAATDETAYADSETINGKLLPVTGSGELDISAATEVSATMDSRAIRPYPPGNFKINASAYPASIGPTDTITVSWAHRDRVQQTDGDIVDTTQGDVGPEAGTTYTLRFYDELDALAHTESGITGTSWEWAAESPLNDSVRVELEAVRDGHTSWQMHNFTVIRS